MSQQGILADQTSPDMDIETLTGNSGGAVGPDAAFNVNVVGASPLTVVGNPGTNTLTIQTTGIVATQYPVDNGGPGVPAAGSFSILSSTSTDFTTDCGIETHVGATTDEMYIENRRWLSEYVVDASSTVGERGTYTTVQAAITAASAAGGGTVYIRPGTYSENLTMASGVNLIGVTPSISTSVVISGTHNFNSVASASYQNIEFTASGGDIIVTTTGSVSTVFSNCFFILSSNTICSTANASFSGTFYNCVAITGSPTNIWAQTAGTFTWYQGVVSSLGGSSITILAAGTSSYIFRNTFFSHDLETTGTASITCNECEFSTGTTETINVNSAGSTIAVSSSTISCNAVSGDFAVGTGTLEYVDIGLTGSAQDINGSLTTTVYDWKPYSTAAASEAAVDKGVCGFDNYKDKLAELKGQLQRLESKPTKGQINRDLAASLAKQYPFGYAQGGVANLSGRYLDGAGDGMSDSILANIEGQQEARLADGEFVVPADVVADMGNGSSNAGAERLYAMMDRIRQARHGTTKQPPEVNVNKVMPA